MGGRLYIERDFGGEVGLQKVQIGDVWGLCLDDFASLMRASGAGYPTNIFVEAKRG